MAAGEVLAGPEVDALRRPPRRRRLVAGAVVAVVLGQGLALTCGAFDPAHRFGFQPFNESSTIAVDVVRVTADGRRIPATEPWPGGYQWDELVGWDAMRRPEQRIHAFSSASTMVGFYRAALDWVATHTPDDDETVRLEATVHVIRNSRPQPPVVLRSVDRELP